MDLSFIAIVRDTIFRWGFLATWLMIIAFDIAMLARDESKERESFAKKWREIAKPKRSKPAPGGLRRFRKIRNHLLSLGMIKELPNE